MLEYPGFGTILTLSLQDRLAMTLQNFPRISADPAICGGRPTIAGTRLRVTDVLEALAAGASEAELLADFDFITRDDIRAVLAYAASATAHPVAPAAHANGASGDPLLDEGVIPNGSHTTATLPPPSPGAKAILATIDAVAPLKEVSGEKLTGAERRRLSIDDAAGRSLGISDRSQPGLLG